GSSAIVSKTPIACATWVSIRLNFLAVARRLVKVELLPALDRLDRLSDTKRRCSIACLYHWSDCDTSVRRRWPRPPWTQTFPAAIAYRFAPERLNKASQAPTPSRTVGSADFASEARRSAS